MCEYRPVALSHKNENTVSTLPPRQRFAARQALAITSDVSALTHANAVADDVKHAIAIANRIDVSCSLVTILATACAHLQSHHTADRTA
jgi:hypothetical protein